MGFVFVHLILVFSVIGVVAAGGEECRPMRCSSHGPEIWFPFQLKGRQPEHCGLPGLQVSCRRGKALMEVHYLENTSLSGIQLLTSQEVHVVYIGYQYQDIEYRIISTTLKLVSTSSSSSFSIAPFPPESKITSFNSKATCVSCSSRYATELYPPPKMVTMVGGQDFPINCFSNSLNVSELSLTSCTIVFTSSLPPEYLGPVSEGYVTSWSIPNCTRCEANGNYCKVIKYINFLNNTAPPDYRTTCVSRVPHQDSVKPIAGIIPGVALVVLILIALLYYVNRARRQKKYDDLKIEMFLANYQAMKPTRYSYADIKKITSNFSEKLGQGGYGSVYKGQITSEIIVAVKVLNSDPNADGEDFINEVGTIGRIYHVNVVRLVGYCADGCNRALIYEFQPNDSLEKFKYSGRNHNNFLGWEKMQGIALGIARGIEYLHQGCAQQILHFDIKPNNILLDSNYNPKISDFGLAKLCSRDQSLVSMTMARGTIGYIAPEVFSRNFGKVSSKSDVYSFGMLLLEMVGSRNNTAVKNDTETYFPEWIYHHLEEGGEVAIQIEKEEDSNIAKKLTIVGLWCIGWHPVDRPSMKRVINMLESQECPAMPPNPFGTSSVRSFATDLEAISDSE
ncbi:rust resistance kinase Lr10 isoform X2 [Daucus carota subsp. sativus]|uniref:rust resistance kinase Lr10 isoform X2 n=1 Tax=Daucus carota subsp. sativus TaxID=79200 RepID=UPI0007F00BC6|nr:PREDICTED: rust resistance kinase Lr10-like isoform X2 [Daucus carota subsp. sativus]